MKIDRRSFLGLGLGAAAGFTVSPVVVKLTDDSSIWTQNWPWTPVPEDGEITYENSVCSLCPGGCGISVRQIKGRPVKIEGQDDYPVNGGGACLHGIAGLQYLYDPARIQTPMRKNGDRFQAISWDEAISIVAGKLADIRKDGGSDSLGLVTGSTDGSMAGLFKRFMDAYGSPNVYAMPSLEGNLELTAATLHGAGNTIGFDLENSDFVLSFGAGIIEGWGSPVACFKANASRKERHAKLYQIEPRLSNTAANADRWIPVKPGTEADLALGLCAVLLKKNLFVPGDFPGGLNRFTANVTKDYSPAKVEAITGVKAADVEKLAMAFAKAKMPVAVPGRGRGDQGQSLREFAAVQTLNALAGRLNKKGGAFIMSKEDYLSFPEASMDETAEAGAGKDKMAGSLDELVATLNGSDKPLLNALFVYNANPCYTLRNPAQVKEAFKRVPFVVSFSSFMDETAMEADVILPASTFLERLEDVPSQAGLPKRVVGLARPMVKPVFNTKNPGDALIRLAQAMGGTIGESFEWETYDECLEAVAEGIWDSLSEDGYAVISEGAPMGSPATDFGYLASGPAGITAQGDGDFVLVPIDNMRLAGTAPASTPFAIKTVSDRVLAGTDIVVEINPASAKGFKDCGDAVLTTAAGKARVKVNFNEGIMPGVIGMARGLGHSFDNPYVAGKGVNVNDLIAPVVEPGSGLDAAFGIKATLSKA
ncbi:MAG: molybdopterin-dependent oxidoreductase [Desulfobacterales bacterium]|nr:molybdopterin-dependent oxidoreductase [Desulfobacterales bacterium]